MTWRYAITRERVESTDEDHYTIREVYTDDEGRISYTEEGIAPRGDSYAECKADFELMAKAFDGTVLDLMSDPPRYRQIEELDA